MPKRFQFEGQTFEFPDDVTDQEALGFIDSATSKAPAPADPTANLPGIRPPQVNMRPVDAADIVGQLGVSAITGAAGSVVGPGTVLGNIILPAAEAVLISDPKERRVTQRVRRSEQEAALAAQQARTSGNPIAEALAPFTSAPVINFGAMGGSGQLPAGTARGVAEGLEGFASSLTQPVNAVLGAGGMLTKAETARRLMSMGFSLDMISHAQQAMPEIETALQEGDTQTAARLITEAAGSTLMAGMAGAHAVQPTPGPTFRGRPMPAAERVRTEALDTVQRMGNEELLAREAELTNQNTARKAQQPQELTDIRQEMNRRGVSVTEEGPRQNRQQRRAAVAVPEEGTSMEQQRIEDARATIAERLGVDPREATPEDLAALDQLAQEGWTGSPPEPIQPQQAAQTSGRSGRQMTDMDRMPSPMAEQAEGAQPRPSETRTAQGLTPEQQLAGFEIPRSLAREEVSADRPIQNETATQQSTSPQRTFREPRTLPVYGRDTEILIPGESKRYRATYSLREAEDVVASHSGQSFEPRPEFEFKNDRNYSEPQNAERIIKQTAEFDPAFLVNDNPTAEQGPPIIDWNGNVLGGNSRTMTLERVRRSNPQAFTEYREKIRAEAKRLGLDPAAVDRMREPVLVRQIVDTVADPQGAITDFNKVGTAELRQAERAIADSRRLSERSLEDITRRIEEQGPEGTLAQALEGDATNLVNRLTDDGVLTLAERPRLMDGQGRLTAEGKQRMTRLLTGRLFEDARHFEETAPELRQKLERIVAPLAKVEGVEGWSITEQVKEAVRLAQEAKSRDLSIDELTAQRGMFGDRNYSAEAIAIAKKLQDKPTEIVRAFRQYASEAELGAGGQMMMGMEPPTAAESFRAAFGLIGDRPAAEATRPVEATSIPAQTRPVESRAVSFEQWLKEKKINPRELPTEFEEVTAMGSVAFGQASTRAQKGKVNSILRKMQRKQELRQQYESEVPVTIRQREIDETNAADQAYMRALEKRRQRAAELKADIKAQLRDERGSISNRVATRRSLAQNLTELAGIYLREGVQRFSEFSRRVAAEVGRVASGALSRAWNAAKRLNDQLGRGEPERGSARGRKAEAIPVKAREADVRLAEQVEWTNTRGLPVRGTLEAFRGPDVALVRSPSGTPIEVNIGQLRPAERLSAAESIVMAALQEMQSAVGTHESLTQMRSKAGLSKERFDAAVLALRDRGRIFLHHHDRAHLQTEQVRAGLVQDPRTKDFYIAASTRPEVSAERAGTQRGSIRIGGEPEARQTGAEAGSGGRGGRTTERTATAAETPEPRGSGGKPAEPRRGTGGQREPIVTSPNLKESRAKAIEKMGLDEKTMRQVDKGLAEWEASNPERRVVTFEDIRNEARERDPLLLSQLDREAAQSEVIRDPAMRYAAKNAINAISREQVTLGDKLADASIVGEERARLQRQADQLERDFRKLTDILIPTRSQIGRTLAFERMMAEQSFDVTYWLDRAKKAQGLPEQVPLPDEVVEKVKAISKRGQEAEAAAVDKVQGDGPITPEQAERQARKELGPEPQPERTRVKPRERRAPEPKPDPTLEEKQARYKERLLERIKQLSEGKAKEKKTSKWELTPEQRAEVERDPEVRAAAREMARTLRDLHKDGWLKFILSGRSAGLLTAPATHLRNIASNAAYQVFNEASRPLGWVADTLVRTHSKATGERAVQGLDIAAMRKAGREGAAKGWEEAKQIMKTGEAPDEGTVLWDFTRELNAKHLFENRPVLKHLAWTNDAINLVFRSLKAEDRFFKRAAFRRSLEEQMAVSKARVPTEEMMVQAWADADFLTFNNQNQAAQALSNATSWARRQGLAGKAGAAVIDFFLPFKNTPANVWMRGFEAMGGGLVTGPVKLFMAEAKLTPAQQRAISMEIGRGATGMGIVLMGMMMYQNGTATGMHPQDEKGQRDLARAAGKQDGAIKIGDKWVSIQGLSPMANLLNVGATLGRKYGEWGDFFSNPDEMLAIFSATVKEQPMLRGLQDLLEFIEGGNRGPGLAASAAGSFVPSILSAAGQATDDTMRETRGGNVLERMGSAVANRTPGLRQTLPPRLDAVGRPIQADRISSLFGFPATVEDDRPALREMERLQVSMSPQQQRKGETDKQFESRMKAARERGENPPERLPDEDREAFERRARATGEATLRRVERMMKEPEYQRGTNEERRQRIEAAVRRIRQRASEKARSREFQAMSPQKQEEYLLRVLR